jgi:hypothetical protein
MTPIVPILKTKTEYFGEETVQKFWLKLTAAASSVNYGNNSMNRLKTCLDSAPKDSVICVFSGELSSKTLCDSLRDARDKGSRIYILTNSYDNEMKILDGCLIRYGGGKRIGAFILINPNSGMPSGCLFTGWLADASVNFSANLLLDLDSEQVRALFRYFCHQFWNKAEKERNGQGKNNEEHNTTNAPLDIYPPAGDSCDFEYLKSVWGKETENARITTGLLAESPYMKFTNFSNSNIVSLFSGINNNLVSSLKQKHNEIFVCHDENDNTLINSIKTTDGAWLIPKTDAAHEEEVYALSLTPAQTKILDGHINAVSRGKTLYQYYEKDTRENIKGKTIFRLGESVSQEGEINPETTVKPVLPAPAELLPKDEFEALKPDFIDDGRSVSITYEWTIVPFKLPPKSDKHRLYQDWENEEKKINEYINQISDNISEIEKSGNIFNRIRHVFAGKQQRFPEYRNDLKILQETRYGGINNQELKNKIKKINEIRSAVENDSGDILEADRKERLDEKQKISREADESVLSSEKGGVMEQEFIDKLKQLVNEQGSTELTDAKKCKAFLADYTKNEYKKESSFIIWAVELNIAKAIKETDDFASCRKAKINELMKIKKLSQEESTAIVDTLALVLREDANYSVTEMPTVKKLSKSRHTRELTVLQLPQLPSVGYLYKHNGQDYLAIMNWEDYDQGKKEAKRLNAKLCAK